MNAALSTFWRPKCLAAALLLLCGVATSGTAHAQDANPAAAEQLFQEGRTLMDQSKFAEACEKFKESARLDVAPGTVLNLAQCYERLGRTASAWARYREVVALSTRRGQPERAAFADTKVKELEPKLVSVVYVVPRPEPGLVVEQDGTDLGRAAWGTRIPVDPGAHQLRVSAPGFRSWSASVFVERSDQRIQVPPLRRTVTTSPAGEPEPHSGGLRLVGVSLLIASGAAAAGTLVLGGVAKLENDKARSDECGATSCSPEGTRRIDRATAFGNVATALGVGTVVLLGAGLVTFFLGGTSPSRNAEGGPVIRF